MNRAETAAIVRQKVAEVLGVDSAEITEDTDLRGEYEVDSLELMEIGARLETALGIRIDVESIVDMDNVGQAVDAAFARRMEQA